MEEGFDRLDDLRKAQRAAVARYDFDSAEEYEREINRLRTSLVANADHSNRQLLHMEIDGRRNKILGESARDSAGFVQRRRDIQERFDDRRRAILERHQRELEEVAHQYRLELDRALGRPVPDADRAERRSRLLGQARKFAQARASFQEAAEIREGVLEERRRACNSVLRRDQAVVKKRHVRELEALEQKRDLALFELEQSLSEFETLVSTRLQASQVRCEAESVIRTVSVLRSPRRSNSVQRSRPHSRS
jgi:hypothetical protein